MHHILKTALFMAIAVSMPAMANTQVSCSDGSGADQNQITFKVNASAISEGKFVSNQGASEMTFSCESKKQSARLMTFECTDDVYGEIVADLQLPVSFAKKNTFKAAWIETGNDSEMDPVRTSLNCTSEAL